MVDRPEPTSEEREAYLEALRGGQPRPVAARSLNKALTGSIFRSYMHRNPAFAAEVEAAEAEGRVEYRDLLEAQLQRRALRIEEKSTKALEVALATELPERYGWLRNGRGGGDDDPMGAPLVKTELLTSGQIEQLVTLIEYGQGKRPNPELQAEIAGRKQIASAHPIIDA